MAPGPRDYSVPTRRALDALSNNRCYFPDCTQPVSSEVDGDWQTNVQIAHIVGVEPEAARHDPSWTDEQLRAYDNLILLCYRHHTAVDSESTRHKYPVELLRTWKRDRESQSSSALGLVNERELRELLDQLNDFLTFAAPRPNVSVTLVGGILDGPGVLSIPIEGLKNLSDQLPPEFDDLPRVLMCTAVNTGGVAVRAEGFGLTLGKGPYIVDDFPGINRLGMIEPHSNVRWLWDWPRLEDTILYGAREAQYFPQFISAYVTLANGATERSEPITIDRLPLWKPGTDTAPLLGTLRDRFGDELAPDER